MALGSWDHAFTQGRPILFGDIDDDWFIGADENQGAVVHWYFFILLFLILFFAKVFFNFFDELCLICFRFCDDCIFFLFSDIESGF